MRRLMPFIVLGTIIGGLALLALIGTYRASLNTPGAGGPPGNAAAPPAPELRGYQALVLLADPLIQGHLGLTDLQKDTVGAIVDEFLDGVVGLTALSEEIQSLSEMERAARWEQIRAQQSAIVAAHDSRAIESLLPEQHQRLGQLALRLRLEEAFYQPDVVRELALSPRQIEQIAARRSEIIAVASELQSKRRDHELSVEEHNSQIARLRSDALGFYESLLTDSQRQTWARLVGEAPPFGKDDLRWQLRRGRNR